jgi:hypothetical protein
MLIIVIAALNMQSKPVESKDFSDKFWVHDHYNPDDGISTYIAKKSFDNEKGGLQFLKNNKLRKRQNEGWCGTPPISYEEVQGDWKKLSDSLIEIRYKNWSGKLIDTIKIISLTDKELIIK